jgi:hypothetical protein
MITLYYLRIGDCSGKHLPEVELVLGYLKACDGFGGVVSSPGPRLEALEIRHIAPVGVRYGISKRTNRIVSEELAASSRDGARRGALPQRLEQSVA